MATILSTAILTMSNLAQKTFHTSSFEGKPSPTLPLFTGFGEKDHGKHHKKGLFVRLSINGSESTKQHKRNSEKPKEKVMGTSFLVKGEMKMKTMGLFALAVEFLCKIRTQIFLGTSRKERLK